MVRLLTTFVLIPAAGLAQLAAGPALSVDAAAGRHPISPDIYGINLYFADELFSDRFGQDFSWDLHTDPAALAAGADLRIPVRRWGGNLASRYDWRLDAWNAGADSFFEITVDWHMPQPERLPDGSRFNMLQDHARRTGGRTLAAVSMLEWLPKARSADQSILCSFSMAKYGPQLLSPAWAPDCGNGIRPDGTPVVNDPSDVAVRTDEHYQAEWLGYLVSRYGRADQGGVAIWELDNEPFWWAVTHRDVHPTPQTYDETAERGIRYAAAIKDADPTALVAGPASPGWPSYYYSLADLVGAGLSFADVITERPSVPFWRNPVDRNAHGGRDFSSWYLQQFRNYEREHGRRLLDYFDLHLYGIFAQPASDAERLRLTRGLWDPQFAATDLAWGLDDLGSPARPYLIPRMREWVEQNYPGTKIALTEYDFGAHKSIVGALAQADALGIFGREGLDLATVFACGGSVAPGDSLASRTTDPFAFAFRIYRNYDGIGGAFGETSVQAASVDPDRISLFAAQRSDNALTILAINKTTADLASAVRIANFAPAGTAQVWRYSPAALDRIVREPDLTLSANGIETVLPGYSITMFVIPRSPAALEVPKPVLLGVVNAASRQSGPVAPGEMVLVAGSGLGSQAPRLFHQQANGLLADTVDGVRVLFDGVPGTLMYVDADQLLAVVPYAAALKPSTHVQVEYRGSRSDPLELAVAPVAPALFTLDGSGRGRAASSSATPGAAVVLWGTGEGATDPPGVEGRLAADILPKPLAACQVQVGGRPAAVEYCGAAPNLAPGVFQIVARLDAEVARGEAVPVEVRIGGVASQSAVTLAVR